MSATAELVLELTDRPRAGTRDELLWLYEMADRANGAERRLYLSEAAVLADALRPKPRRRRKVRP
ncbi:hypothetical protein FE249_00875 [Acidiphilium multivorum]|uniref:hypothetical protein n=1 Tax=Acidiphilium multivorum TaxID=62140 RepID=UPI001F4BD44D|nr:hypothetical protein [Acidiphilium multivorum]UNC12881.1 hypothetical protein FE249_00875 [Acidiphilium multivorum]